MAVPVQFAKMDAEVARAEEWKKLNSEAGGNEEWPPIAIKAAYVFGLIYDLSESVDWLLKHPKAWPITYMTGVVTFLSAVELLGRCLNGDDKIHKPRNGNLSIGLKYLFCIGDAFDSNKILMQTSHTEYSIGDIVNLRNYLAHGQATSKLVKVDIEFLDKFPPRLANAMERYWNELQQDVDLCDKLAKANILPLRSIPVETMWDLLEWDEIHQKYHTMTEVFSRFDWQVYK